MADNRLCGFGTTGCLGITILFIAMRSCTNLRPFPFSFFSGRIGELQGPVYGIISPSPFFPLTQGYFFIVNPFLSNLAQWATFQLLHQVLKDIGGY